MWPWTTKPVLIHWGIFVAIARKKMGKKYRFSFMLEIIRILSKDHVPWRYFVHFLNISNLTFRLIIRITKDLIWTTLQAIFSIYIYIYIYTLRFSNSWWYLSQILSYPNTPYINGKRIYLAFMWHMNLNFNKLTLVTDFVVTVTNVKCCT